VKSRSQWTFFVAATIALSGLFAVSSAQAVAQTAQPRTVVSSATASSASRGMTAIDEAAKDGKYLFVFFWKQNDTQSQTMYKVLKTATAKWADSADLVSIPIIDRKEKAIIDKFDVSRAPMPLVLALAPNGAITKACPIKFDEKQLQEGFVSPCTAKCLKCLQDQKIVLLCVQNQKTQFSQAAWKGAQDFKADARFAKATEVVSLDPSDQAEATFLGDLEVDPKTLQAVTVLLAPPGQPIAKFAGVVTKDQIVAKVSAAQSGPCAGGQCGPGGCCPK